MAKYQTNATQSASTRTTDAPPPSLSGKAHLLTDGVRPSLQYRQTVNTGNFTPTSRQQSQNTNAAAPNDPRLLADGLRAIVRMLTTQKLLTLGRLADGRRVIILPSTVWNDDITLKDKQ